MLPLILASTALYRAELLTRLQMPFDAIAPNVDETPLDRETPAATAERLAQAKARAVGTRFPGALVIGSDQVADLDGAAIGKPGTRAMAVAQLRAASGRRLIFHTAIALFNSRSGNLQSRVVPTSVTFRILSDRDIESYLDKEAALDCAGSAKSEGLGIALIAALDGSDPTALIGLPLIALVDMLRQESVTVL